MDGLEARPNRMGRNTVSFETGEMKYASFDRQEELRRRIEAQDLPIRHRMRELTDRFAAAACGSGVFTLLAPTGSGKSVFSPVAVRAAIQQLGLPDRILMMQPRRDAASGIARAVAAVSREELGKGVGFRTSEAKVGKSDSAIVVVTPGVLLRYLQEGAVSKDSIGALILDEVHEGSLDNHLALGLIKYMREQGSAPPVLLTSATFDAKRMHAFFGSQGDDHMEVEGRSHPIDHRHCSPGERPVLDDRGVKYGYISLVVDKVIEVCRSDQEGDVLVFMPGMREIQQVINGVRAGIQTDAADVLPLHGSLSPQDRDFALSIHEGGRRRVIVSTNIAETSVTVPGIKIVVDSCRERSVVFNPSTGIVERGTGLISRSQAIQRAGRAGRVAPGVCYRILSAQEFDALPEYPASEIRRANLSQVVMRLKGEGIDPRTFPFMEAPQEGAIDHGIKTLIMVGALDEQEHLTDIGLKMKELPFEPHIARMVVEAQRRGCIEAALVIAAFEREQNVLLLPSHADIERTAGVSWQDKRRGAQDRIRDIRNVFSRGNSDLLQSLNIFIAAIDNGVIEAMRSDGIPEGIVARNQFRAWCNKYYLKASALEHIAYRLQDYAHYAGMRLDYSMLGDSLRTVDDESLGAAIVAGYPADVLCLTSGYGLPTYIRALGGNQEITLSPGSAAFHARPALCVAGSIAEGRGTHGGHEITRNYASDVHPVSGVLLREIHPHLVREQESSPAYDPSTDTCVASVTYTTVRGGVQLGVEKRVIAGARAVEVFARAMSSGIIGLPCESYNRDVLGQLDALYARSRGRVQKPNMDQWYADRLGGISTKEDAVRIDDRLRLSLRDYCDETMQEELNNYYPTSVRMRDFVCSVKYHLTPAIHSPWHNTPETFGAVITIPADAVLSIENSDMPVIGVHGTDLQVRYRTTIGRTSFEQKDIESLKNAIDEHRCNAEWEAWWSGRSEKVVEAVALRPLPSVESLGMSPMKYAERRSGEALYAYPAIVTYQTYDSMAGVFEHRYIVRYFQTQEEALRNQRDAEQQKEADNEQERQRKDREVLLEPARTLMKSVEDAVAEAKADPVMIHRSGMTADDFFALTQLYSKAVALLERHGRIRADADPRGAIALFEEVQQTLRAMPGEVERRMNILSDTRSLYDSVYAIANGKLNNAPMYGIYGETESRMRSDLQEAQQRLDPNASLRARVAFDPDGARRILMRLQSELAGYSGAVGAHAAARLGYVGDEGTVIASAGTSGPGVFAEAFTRAKKWDKQEGQATSKTEAIRADVVASSSVERSVEAREAIQARSEILSKVKMAEALVRAIPVKVEREGGYSKEVEEIQKATNKVVAKKKEILASLAEFGDEVARAPMVTLKDRDRLVGKNDELQRKAAAFLKSREVRAIVADPDAPWQKTFTNLWESIPSIATSRLKGIVEEEKLPAVITGVQDMLMAFSADIRAGRTVDVNRVVDDVAEQFM